MISLWDFRSSTTDQIQRQQNNKGRHPMDNKSQALYYLSSYNDLQGWRALARNHTYMLTYLIGKIA